MKSIEALEYLDDIAHGRIMDYDPHELKLIVEKDLEVLEIIKNRNVNLFKLKRVFTNLEDIDDVLLAYNACSFRNEQITLEELLKLKQWMEENENE